MRTWPMALLLAGCCSVQPLSTTTLAFGPATAFPGPADFQGAFATAGAPVTDGLQSTYDGTIVVTMLDRALVQSALASGLRLATPNSPSATQHPVIYLIGKQRDPSTVQAGVATRIPTASDYHEMILIVPFVVNGTGTRWHNYVVRMYLDDYVAVQGGNLLYGYAKEWAQLKQSGAPAHLGHEVAGWIVGPTYFLADVRLQAPGGAQGPPPRWGDLKTLFEMPILGLNTSGFVCSYWEWDFSNSQLAPATSYHRFVTSFRGGMEGWPALGTVASAPDGAVALSDVRWRLAAPFSCVF